MKTLLEKLPIYLEKGKDAEDFFETLKKQYDVYIYSDVEDLVKDVNDSEKRKKQISFNKRLMQDMTDSSLTRKKYKKSKALNTKNQERMIIGEIHKNLKKIFIKEASALKEKNLKLLKQVGKLPEKFTVEKVRELYETKY